MSKSLRTQIEWADYTLNFWWGCTKVSPACEHCYAEVISKVFSKGRATWGRGGARWLQWEGATQKLWKIVRAAKREGVRPRVFVNSMSDTFEENALLDVTRCMALVATEEVKSVDFLLLTKRPENVRKMVPPAWLEKWPAHVWIGTTVEDQAAAEERIPHLLCVPAAVRFLSCEPLLGPLDIEEALEDVCDGGYVLGSGPIHWVICGGESGGGARPMHPDWARSLRDQCAATNVPFFFKQWGEWLPLGDYRAEHLSSYAEHPSGRNRYAVFPYRAATGVVHLYSHPQDLGEISESMQLERVGKKAAGRLLDGVEHNAVPANTEGSASSSK